LLTNNNNVNKSLAKWPHEAQCFPTSTCHQKGDILILNSDVKWCPISTLTSSCVYEFFGLKRNRSSPYIEFSKLHIDYFSTWES
jgi:hypothetical protein